MENLFSNQELVLLVITIIILMTFMIHSLVILRGEVKGWLLLGVEGLHQL